MKRIILLLIILSLILSFLVGCEQEPPEPKVYEYKVISVQTYMKVTSTNTFGAILRQELRYNFTYIDSDGQLYQFSDFYHTQGGCWKLCLGKENKYVVKEHGMSTYRYLYLTEETFNNLSVQ